MGCRARQVGEGKASKQICAGQRGMLQGGEESTAPRDPRTGKTVYADTPWCRPRMAR